ncbi:hypothetical protein Csa_012958, partial [Cucumis sativus]
IQRRSGSPIAVGLRRSGSSSLRRKFMEMEKNGVEVEFFGFYPEDDKEERENK